MAFFFTRRFLRRLTRSGACPVRTALFLICCHCLPAFSLTATAQDTPADRALRKAADFEKIPRVAVPEGPFMYLTETEIQEAALLAEKEEWAKKTKKRYTDLADTWLQRDYAFVQHIVPVWGSVYVYGLGKDLDPVHHKKMKWRGWNDPFHVVAEDGSIYPNANYPDTGMGWTDTASKETYYFIANCNGWIIEQLEATELPALVNAYLLTGKEAYAERALWILDAIATIYPRANEGPIDYPGLAPGKADGGRLDRPYYQAARAMMRYAYFAEMLFRSNHAKEISKSNSESGYTMRKNIELNLLMNGADYCLRMAKASIARNTFLTNGNIDYNRAPLVVGAMLGIPEWVDWAMNSAIGFRRVISNAIDINGRYFETSTLYSDHTRSLLLTTSSFLKRMRMPQYPDGYNAYNDLRFARFALNFFTDIQVAGRLPLFGDSGPDDLVKKQDEIFDRGTVLAAKEFYDFSEKEEVRQLALETAAGMLKYKAADYIPEKPDLFRMSNWKEFVKATRQTRTSSAVKRSSLFFDAGVAILRSGQSALTERAALLRFGPTLNHGQADELGLNFFALGREFSYDPGYYNTHLRFGFTTTTVAHNVLVANRTNQLRWPSSGGDLQTWTDGEVLKSVAADAPGAYVAQGLSQYKRRVALIDLSPDESYIIDNFWAEGAMEYDYSLHGIAGASFRMPATTSSLLRETGKGSVFNEEVDYSRDMDLNGRVTSFKEAPFYFAPPGAGYGFLSKPAFYRFNNPMQMQWSATDSTGHEMYAWQFAPPGSELIVAESPKGPIVLSNAGETTPLDLTYTLAHTKQDPSQPVNFMSVIVQTAGKNKLADVKRLSSRDTTLRAFAYRIKPDKAISGNASEHIYMVSHQPVKNASFEQGLLFSGEEGFLSLDASGKIIAASLTGEGSVQKQGFRFTVKPLLNQNLRVLEIKENPLRIRVDASYEDCRKLEGAVLRVNRTGLIRPFVIRVNKCERKGAETWLILDASDNTVAEGTVRAYDSTGIHTDAPFPHTRPFVYTFSEKTGFGTGLEKGVNYTYNGGYNGFWLVTNRQPNKKNLIKDITDTRSVIRLTADPGPIHTGDEFKIQLLAPGDELEVPVWGQAKRDAKGNWQIAGPATIRITGTGK